MTGSTCGRARLRGPEPSYRPRPPCLTGLSTELVRLRTPWSAAAPGAALLPIDVLRAGGGALREAPSLVPGSHECGAGALTRTEPPGVPPGIQNGRVRKHRGPQLPACSWRAGPPRGMLGAGKETRVCWRRVGGAADTAFASPRASRLPWKREEVCRLPRSAASQKERPPFGEAAGRVRLVCPGCLPPAAEARSVFWCSKAASSLISLQPCEARRRNTPRSKANGFQGKSVPGTCNQARNEKSSPTACNSRALQFGSFQT